MVQYLDVRIRRSHVLQDALNQLMQRPGELKKPLRVTFISGGVDEEGLDEGGVTKEFFQLLIRQIFNEVWHVNGTWNGAAAGALRQEKAVPYQWQC